MCQKNNLNGNLFYELINASKLKSGLACSDYLLHLLTVFLLLMGLLRDAVQASDTNEY